MLAAPPFWASSNMAFMTADRKPSFKAVVIGVVIFFTV